MVDAMALITRKVPCIKFEPKTSSSPNFVTIVPGPDCSSVLGMAGGEQHLNMNSGCFEDGLLKPVHELLHTLGFVHEHTRPDRDDFIDVNLAQWS